MHREIAHADEAFQKESRLSLYLLTGLLGLILLADVWPAIAAWTKDNGIALPTWPRDISGYRIALIAAILGGARTLYGAVESLLEGRLCADLAIAIACIAAILIGEPLVAAEIIFIGMVGECLESFTFARTQRTIQHIVEVFPRRCWVLRDGQEVRVRTNELVVGDRVVVKPGARIPVDGVVVDGRSSVDQSALTGESLPIEKGPVDEVLAGALNQVGALTIEARRVSEQTVLGRVIELTARALKDKAPLERTADRLARYFLPAVLGLAAVTFLGRLILRWFALRPEGGTLGWADVTRSVYPALSVLVVSCPCALILATPAAIIAALGRLAGTGILIKGGSALERLATVTAFAFDKTGTLTEGRLTPGNIVPVGGISADELLRLAASAEQRSEHPLARLLLDEAARKSLPLGSVEDFQAQPGLGVRARSSQGKLLVGTRRLLEEKGIALNAEVVAALETFDAAGQTALLVARDETVLGVIGARDTPRPEAPGVIAELQALGIHDIALLTGDRSAVARAIGTDVGVTDVHAELLPDQKAEFIRQWQADRKVAMVGDGINDAPSLARADVGIAIGGTGTDVAAEAGDIVFMGDPLRSLPLLLRLSRETVRIIRQNILVFAIGVNIVGVVLTAWLWPLFSPSAAWYEQGPVAAVVYHQIGSLAVLLNAMRLLWFERASTSPAATRFRTSLRRLDHWMEHHLDAHEFGHFLEHHWRPVLGSLVLLLVVLYGLSGLTQVNADEIAVVRRFGRPVDDLGPGLYWRWPRPIEDVTRVQPARVHTVEIGFRTSAAPESDSIALAWSSPHASTGFSRMSEEAVMITGDGNLIELQATVRYVISRPRRYLLANVDVDAVVRAVCESALRDTVAGQPFLELLTTHRERFQQEALARIRTRCRQYGILGIELQGLSLHDLHPPQEVVPAYHDVANAMEARDRLVNDAVADATRKKRAAQASALRIEREAKASAQETVQQAEAARAAFLARYRMRSQLSLREEWRLLADALAEVWHGRPSASAYRQYEERRSARLVAQSALTDFRLFWDALSQALTGREKMIIDADQVPGRRHLLLMDPDQFRVPVPVLTSPERSRVTPRRTPVEGP
jgi:P-type Cu+ transporter